MHALSGWLVGLLLGMRHALEPDHLAAVSTLVAGQRAKQGGLRLGAFWGLGHTLALLAVGATLALFEAQMPARLADLFELGVAVMLVGLGARAIWRAAAQGREGTRRLHAHDDLLHEHEAGHAHVHLGGWTFAARPLLVGLVHGLAGSGALTALVLAGLPTTRARLVYIALFGAGSVLSMALISGALGWPLSRLSRNPQVARALGAVSGLISAALGLFWGWPLLGRLF